MTCKTCQCQWCGPMKPHVAACGECGGTRGHRDACAVVAKAERQQREAPLLALVAAVPEGLNPIGWRAAVLGYTDNPAPVDVLKKIPRLAKMLGEFVRLVATGMSVDGAADRLFWIAAKEDEEMATGRVVQAMNNYARAIAPHKAPPPERKRGPGLPIDDGGHYE